MIWVWKPRVRMGGCEQAPNGYTEDTLFHWRRVRKAMDRAANGGA
jgi:hypothetical protein